MPPCFWQLAPTWGSNNTQVNIGLRVLTRPIPAQLPEIYRTLGTDYAERVLPSIIQVWRRLLLFSGIVRAISLLKPDPPTSAELMPQESLKSVIAQYNASQLLTMREVDQDNFTWMLPVRCFIGKADARLHCRWSAATSGGSSRSVHATSILFWMTCLSRNLHSAVTIQQLLSPNRSRSRMLSVRSLWYAYICCLGLPGVSCLFCYVPRARAVPMLKFDAHGRRWTRLSKTSRAQLSGRRERCTIIWLRHPRSTDTARFVVRCNS